MKVVGVLSALVSIFSLILNFIPDRKFNTSIDHNLMLQQMESMEQLHKMDTLMLELKSHVLALELFSDAPIDSSLRLNFETDFQSMNGPMIQNADIYYASEFWDDSVETILTPFTHVYEQIRSSPSVYSISYSEAERDAQSIETLNYVVVLDFKELILPKAISDSKFEMGEAKITYQLFDLRKHQLLKEGIFTITSKDHTAYYEDERSIISKKPANRQASLNVHFFAVLGEKLTEELRKSCLVESSIVFPEMR